jgi:MFS family permease
MSGLLIGVLLSRTMAGLVAQVAGWRSVYVLAAVLTAAVALLLWRQLPVLAPVTKMRYPALLGSVLRLIREEPVLRLRMSYGFCTYASFGAFWASYGFLLARPPYNWSQAATGLFALVGVAGAMAARFAGGLADRGLARYATGGCPYLFRQATGEDDGHDARGSGARSDGPDGGALCRCRRRCCRFAWARGEWSGSGCCGQCWLDAVAFRCAGSESAGRRGSPGRRGSGGRA